MKVRFYSISDDRRVVNKTIPNTYTEKDCDIWDSCSIMRPLLKLAQDNNVINKNYAYIADWGRYYYVSPADIDNGREMYLQLEEDVLKSWQSDIENLQCTVVRTAKNGRANLYLDDGKFKVLNYPRIQTKKFPNSLSKTLSYVLTIAGGE